MRVCTAAFTLLILFVVFVTPGASDAKGEEMPVTISGPPPAWMFRQLTDNVLQDFAPVTDGEHVVWLFGNDGMALYNIANETFDFSAVSASTGPPLAVRGNHVVWFMEDGMRVRDIAAGTIETVPGDPVTMRLVDILSNEILYTSPSDGGFDVFTYRTDLKTTQQLTTAGAEDISITVRDSDLAWTSNFQSQQGVLFYHDAGTGQTTQISTSDKAGPQVFVGDYLVWRNVGIFGFEVFATNLNTFETQLLASEASSQLAALNDVAYWTAPDDMGDEVFAYDAQTSTVTQITNDDYVGLQLRSGGSTIAWFDVSAAAGNTGEMHFFDGLSEAVLEDAWAGFHWDYTLVSDPAIGTSAGNVLEIVAFVPIPEPSSLLLIGSGVFIGLAIGQRQTRRARS